MKAELVIILFELFRDKTILIQIKILGIMATTDFERLITPELSEALSGHPLYSQDAKKKDAKCITVFYLGNIRWYILEGQPEGDDFTLYGIVTGLQETEYGYLSANEMAGITCDASGYGLGNLRIEQDKEFKPCILAEIDDEELQAFLSRLYDNDLQQPYKKEYNEDYRNEPTDPRWEI